MHVEHPCFSVSKEDLHRKPSPALRCLLRTLPQSRMRSTAPSRMEPFVRLVWVRVVVGADPYQHGKNRTTP